MISPSQRPLPDNTQHSQQTNIHAPGGIRTHNLSRRAAKDLRLRPCDHWDRLEGRYCFILSSRTERCSKTGLEQMSVSTVRGNISISPFSTFDFHSCIFLKNPFSLSLAGRIFSSFPCILALRIFKCPKISARYASFGTPCFIANEGSKLRFFCDKHLSGL